MMRCFIFLYSFTMLLGATWVHAQEKLVTANVSREAFSQMLPGLNADQRDRFYEGRFLFMQAWVTSPILGGFAQRDRSFSGLGPLHNRMSCQGCHPKLGRGEAPEQPDTKMHSMLVRLSEPGASQDQPPIPHAQYGDQLNEVGVVDVPGEGWASLNWQTESIQLSNGDTVLMRKPAVVFHDLAYGPLDEVEVSLRVAPSLVGVGLLDAVDDDTLQAIEQEDKPDGVAGHINWVWSMRRQQLEPGRFGLKANQPDLEQQVASALLGDMGLTSFLFPRHGCGREQAACQQFVSAQKPANPELDAKRLSAIVFFLSHVAPPAARNQQEADVLRGRTLFTDVGCGVCHRQQLKTGTHSEFESVINQTIAPYTDLLVHDMGDELADHRPDFAANGREWRTPALWGLGLMPRVNGHTQLLHDGRARNITEAILWHGGEGHVARDRFVALSESDQKALLQFLQSL